MRAEWVEKNLHTGQIKGEIPYLAKMHLCAVNESTGGNACYGDSGGPLMYKNPANNRWYLIGVVSGGWDKECGLPRVPGIYSSVTYYREFIKNFTNEACFKPY